MADRPRIRKVSPSSVSPTVRVTEGSVEARLASIEARLTAMESSGGATRVVESKGGITLTREGFTGAFIIVDREGVAHAYAKENRAREVFQYLTEQQKTGPFE